MASLCPPDYNNTGNLLAAVSKIHLLPHVRRLSLIYRPVMSALCVSKHLISRAHARTSTQSPNTTESVDNAEIILMESDDLLFAKNCKG